MQVKKRESETGRHFALDKSLMPGTGAAEVEADIKRRDRLEVMLLTVPPDQQPGSCPQRGIADHRKSKIFRTSSGAFLIARNSSVFSVGADKTVRIGKTESIPGPLCIAVIPALLLPVIEQIPGAADADDLRRGKNRSGDIAVRVKKSAAGNQIKSQRKGNAVGFGSLGSFFFKFRIIGMNRQRKKQKQKSQNCEESRQTIVISTRIDTFNTTGSTRRNLPFFSDDG